MAEIQKTRKGREESDTEIFENRPSDLDESTHAELRLMFDRASEAILFAKKIQWQSVGACLLVFVAIIGIAFFGASDKPLVKLLGIVTIILTCGVIFVLIMYQFWQFNEINKITEIERHFSTLYLKIRDLKSRREGNFHRYTLLLFMCTTVIVGAIITNLVIKRLL